MLWVVQEAAAAAPMPPTDPGLLRSPPPWLPAHPRPGTKGSLEIQFLPQPQRQKIWAEGEASGQLDEARQCSPQRPTGCGAEGDRGGECRQPVPQVLCTFSARGGPVLHISMHWVAGGLKPHRSCPHAPDSTSQGDPKIQRAVCRVGGDRE